MLPLPGSDVFYIPASTDTSRTSSEWWPATVVGIDPAANRVSLLAINPAGGQLFRSGVSEGYDPGEFSKKALSALPTAPLSGYGYRPNTVATGIISTDTKFWNGSGIQNVSSGDEPGEVSFDLVNTEVSPSEVLLFNGSAYKGDERVPLLVAFGGNVSTGRRHVSIFDRKGRHTDGIVSFHLDRLETPTAYHRYS